jgi:glycosyltransferase involved in cell wall biosynthesis
MRNISRGAGEAGYKTYCAYGRYNKDKVNPETDIIIGSMRDVYLHYAYTHITNKRGLGPASRKSTIEFVKQVEQMKPDIIHLHNLHGYYLNIEILFDYLRYSKIPIVYSLHDCWALTGHCGYFDAVRCEKWKTGCFKCPQTHSIGSRGLFDNSRYNWQRKRELFTSLPEKQMTLVTHSKWLAGLVDQSYMQKYSTVVISGGIDTEVFKPATSDFRENYGVTDKVVLLGAASTWDRRKGLRDFVDLSLLLDEKYKIVLVGLSSKQLRQLPDSILGFPRTESLEGLAQIYSAADVYLNLSCEETMGLTTVEALACGTPVIVYNKTALPEFVDNGKTGFVVESNPSSVFECLQAIQENLPRSSDCVSWGRRYEARSRSQKYLRIYHEMLSHLVSPEQ